VLLLILPLHTWLKQLKGAQAGCKGYLQNGTSMLMLRSKNEALTIQIPAFCGGFSGSWTGWCWPCLARAQGRQTVPQRGLQGRDQLQPCSQPALAGSKDQIPLSFLWKKWGEKWIQSKHVLST